MKGDITIKILETIGSATIAVIDLFDVFLSAGYGASLGRFEYALAKREKYEEPERKASQRYYSLLHRLEKQGLIERKKRSGGVFIRLTGTGRKRMNMLKERRKESLPPRRYKKEEGERKFTIIAFDIPEERRRKRVWLRSALHHIGMRMMQKSVWAGKVKLPKEFLSDLQEFKVIDYIEIFEVTRSGSLHQIS